MTGLRTLDPHTLIETLPELGSPPVVYTRLMEVLEDAGAGASDVAEVISMDAALTVRLLRLVNSAGFARRCQIDSVSQAVGVLGTTRVRDLALATSVTTFFKEVPAEMIHATDFWRHSLATGVGARVIAGYRKEPNAERFFVAGLLHDLGRLVLYLAAPEEAKAILEHANDQQMQLYDAEREFTGFDHGTVGGALMEHWNMPDALMKSIELHHSPTETTRYSVDASTVHLADAFAHELDLGRSGEALVPPRAPEALETLGIDADLVPSVLEEIEKQFGDAVRLFGLSEET